MSLMRWLAVGRSLKSVEDRRSPYKMTQQNLLPRFGQKVGPCVEQGMGLVKGVWVQLWRSLWCWVVDPWRPVWRKLAGKVEAGKWRHPFRRRQRRATQVVQTELLLESIRVVRNDLSESDFKLAPPLARPAATPKIWGRITSRIFRSDQNVR
ncbi:MAG: hypothetical protein L0Y58_08670 [Verrucomicrobia subdivision 3 bacterium]|nr:hypothetical protein [Limisphaerales bacterium]